MGLNERFMLLPNLIAGYKPETFIHLEANIRKSRALGFPISGCHQIHLLDEAENRRQLLVTLILSLWYKYHFIYGMSKAKNMTYLV